MPRRIFYIAEIMEHSPERPNSVNELSFTIRWEGYNDPSQYTVEHWATNETLHTNSVVISYMRRHYYLQDFVRDTLYMTRARMNSRIF
jgi:hypothetical protein